MTFLYRIVYRLALLALFAFNRFSPKLKKGVELRKSIFGQPPWLAARTITRPIWIHCASGEFEYALPLIRTIKQKNPQQKILITYFTPSYVKRIEQEPLVDLVLPSPWDTPSTVAKFLAYHKPKALLFARTDVWFEMTRQCHAQKIPVAVFSMTFNKKLSGFRLFFQKWLFQYIDYFFVVSSHDKENLKTVVPENKITATGDTRYEQCLYRLNLHVPLKIDITATIRKVFIAGSTWTEDEDVLLPFISKNPDLCHWILVPHEVDEDHIKALLKKCDDHRLKPILYSQTSAWNMQGVLIVDVMGALAHLYKIADFSFVGGSYKKQVHSVMESLACGCLTFVGPHHTNNREALEFSKVDSGFPVAPVQVCEVSEFEQKVLTGHKLWTATQSDRLKALVESKARVSGMLYDTLQERIFSL